MESKTPCPKECPDRSYSPNCHSTCRKYLDWLEEQKKIKQKRKEYNKINGLNISNKYTERTLKIFQKHNKRRKDGY